MVRVRWSRVDGVLMATRRGYVVRVWPNGDGTYAWTLKTPDGKIFRNQKASKSEASACRIVRDKLVSATPEAEPKEQLSIAAGQPAWFAVPGHFDWNGKPNG